MKNDFYNNLDFYVPEVYCELNYKKDYELLIATVLSAQCTDKRVNEVTKDLFDNYDLNALANLSKEDLIEYIRPCGSFNKKSEYILSICKSLINNYNGIVPNNREYLESLPGVGRKTANVVLKHLYDVPCIPVDTHVERVSKRLGLVPKTYDVLKIEKRLQKLIPTSKWNRVSEQLLLFGRYYCKAVNPLCDGCLFKDRCKKKQ